MLPHLNQRADSSPPCGMVAKVLGLPAVVESTNRALLQKAEVSPLLIPRERDVGGSKQAPTSKGCRLATFGDRNYDVRSKPAHPKKLPEMPLAVVHDEGVL